MKATLDFTPLSFAAITDTMPIAKLLIDNGAYVKAKDHDGWTTLRRSLDCDAPLYDRNSI